MILLESTVSDFFHDTHISFHIVIIVAFISSDLVMSSTFLSPYQLLYIFM